MAAPLWPVVQEVWTVALEGGVGPLVPAVARAEGPCEKSHVVVKQWPFIRPDPAALIADLEYLSEAMQSTRDSAPAGLCAKFWLT